MATLEQALAAKSELETKFASEEPWKESYCGIGIGRSKEDATDRYVSVFVRSEVPKGTYPTEHNGVAVILRLNPQTQLHAQ